MFVDIIENTLSDGSHVYNVKLDGAVTLTACTLNDAVDLSEKLIAAINAHTTLIAQLRDGPQVEAWLAGFSGARARAESIADRERIEDGPDHGRAWYDTSAE